MGNMLLKRAEQTTHDLIDDDDGHERTTVSGRRDAAVQQNSANQLCNKKTV
jgi:hypothetical protein